MREEDKKVEEVLEFIWSERDRGRSSVEKILEIDEVRDSGADKSTISAMEEAGLITISGDHVKLTARGEELSRMAIRRHRLAERLLTEVLELDTDTAERTACDFEHSLSEVVTESICTLLGHPPVCPHGHRIPPGECCDRAEKTIQPIVKPLGDLSIGEEGKIIYILSSSHVRLDKLGSMGIVPGSTIRLHQRLPAFVVQLGETTLAIDPDIAQDIYVKSM